MAQRKVLLRENEQVQARGRAVWPGSEPEREGPARPGTSWAELRFHWRRLLTVFTEPSHFLSVGADLMPGFTAEVMSLDWATRLPGLPLQPSLLEQSLAQETDQLRPHSPHL